MPLYTIAPTPDGLRVTLELSSERYVAAVLSAEAAPDEPGPSLEALAIAARTFRTGKSRPPQSRRLRSLRQHSLPGPAPWAYKTRHLPGSRNTASIYLWNGSRRASIYYTRHCGGISDAASDLWPPEHAPYLISHADPYCLRRSPAIWKVNVSLNELYRIASEQHWNLPTPIIGDSILARPPEHIRNLP